MKRICICGAGHQGLAMAAHFLLCGNEVALWNKTKANIADVIESGVIKSCGIIHGSTNVPIVSDNIEECISDLIMITAPSSAHRDIARILAPYINKDMVIVLNPGRSFGCLDFAKTLKSEGVDELPHIAETQTILYTCRKISQNAVNIYTLKDKILISSLIENEISTIISKLPNCIKDRFVPCYSQIEMALSNVGMLLHCAPVLMNAGWIECSSTEFKYYYDGISPSVARLIEKIDEERLNIAFKLGVKVLSLVEWLKHVYGISGNSIFECIKNNDSYKEINAPISLDTRYIWEDLPNGLVPLEAIGKEIGCECTTTSLVIDLASKVYDVDFRSIGRVYSINDEFLSK